MYKIAANFFSGIALSFITFKVLPFAFLNGLFFNTVFILLGILFSNFTEINAKVYNTHIYNLLISICTTIVAISFFMNINSAIFSFSSGNILYAASDCITLSSGNRFKDILIMYLFTAIGVFVGLLLSLYKI